MIEKLVIMMSGGAAGLTVVKFAAVVNPVIISTFANVARAINGGF